MTTTNKVTGFVSTHAVRIASERRCITVALGPVRLAGVGAVETRDLFARGESAAWTLENRDGKAVVCRDGVAVEDATIWAL